MNLAEAWVREISRVSRILQYCHDLEILNDLHERDGMKVMPEAEKKLNGVAIKVMQDYLDRAFTISGDGDTVEQLHVLEVLKSFVGNHDTERKK